MSRTSTKKSSLDTSSAVKIPLDQIELGNRLRDPRPEDVLGVQTSMAEVGLLSPIGVRLVPDGKYRIIYGAHRFQAAQNLHKDGVSGWEEIEAIIFECSEADAQIKEIDENLRRVELTAYDQAEFFYRRYQIWVEQYGELKRGRKPKNYSNASNNSSATNSGSYFESAARETGLDHTTIRLAIKRRSDASPELWRRIKGTDVARNGALLDRLLKSSKPGEVIDLAEEKHGGDIEAALNDRVPKVKTAPTVERVFKVVNDAFLSWTPSQKKEFLKLARGLK